MKKVFRILLIAVIAAVFVGTFIFLWRKTLPVKTVYEIVTPVRDTISQFVVATGKVEPRDEVLIKPQIAGIISEVHRVAGEAIRKGDIIATVKVIPDMSTLSAAESSVAQNEISFQQATREFNRTKGLFDQKVITLEEFEKSQTQLQLARENLQSAKDNLEIVRDGILRRNAAGSNTQIRSTIDGMILDVPVKVGSSVIQSNTFNDGTTIATIANMNDMIFRGKVDETDVGKLAEKMPVSIAVGAVQGVMLDAALEYVSPKAVDENGVIMFEIKAAVNSRSDVFVRAGYSANANIKIISREGVLTVPESVLEFEDGKTYVYVLTSSEKAADQTFDRKEVTIGLSDGINVEVVKGMTEKNKVRGLERPKDDKSKKA